MEGIAALKEKGSWEESVQDIFSPPLGTLQIILITCTQQLANAETQHISDNSMSLVLNLAERWINRKLPSHEAGQCRLAGLEMQDERCGVNWSGPITDSGGSSIR